MTATAKEESKRSDDDKDCRKVVSDYFDRTGDMLEKQVKICRRASKKVASGKYTAEDAQKDWQEYFDSAAEYGRESTRLWFEGVTRCAFAPGMWVWRGCGDMFGGDDKRGGS